MHAGTQPTPPSPSWTYPPPDPLPLHRDPANTSLTFLDGTPDYMHIPSSACRIATAFPDARIVVLLRDPVARALSQVMFVLLRYTALSQVMAARLRYRASSQIVPPQRGGRVHLPGLQNSTCPPLAQYSTLSPPAPCCFSGT